jgi:membrane fusion protein (multidrug efflux system)
MKKIYIIASIVTATVMFAAMFFIAIAPTASLQATADMMIEPEPIEEPLYKTVTPIPKDGNGTRAILGTVISNEIANVYPRRQGIVKDVLVDIGDTVKTGQVLAVLLPPGVDGLGSAMIGEKQAYVGKAQANLEDTKAQADLMLQESEKMVTEKMVTLKNSNNNNDVKIREASSSLKTMEENEMAKKNLAEQELESVKFLASQMMDQAEVSVYEARRIIEQVLVGKSSRQNHKELSIRDIPSEFAATNTILRDKIVSVYNRQLSTQNSTLSEMTLNDRASFIQTRLMDANNLLDILQDILRETVTSDQISPEILTNMRKDANDGQMRLLSMNERIQNAINMMYEKERMLRTTETNAEINIEAAKKNLEKMTTMQASDLRMLRTEVDLLEKQLELTKNKQEQNINKAQKDLNISRAMLSVEYAASGNTQILSPFNGIIAKRNLQVGEAASPGVAAFELTSVTTTLSKIAKREIEFGLPEDMNETIDIGETLVFFVPGNETQTFESIVTRKSPKIDTDSRTFIMRAKLDNNQEIPHNTVVRLRLQNESPQTYTLPTPAVVREDGNNFVWELTPEGEVIKKSVNVLAGEGEFSDVSGDFTPETRIIVDPVHLTTTQNVE